ncbi:hypothetical protein C4565_09515 [Candidatus Parcubacteria bacterium]|nr:MAG: hypothetical protein C4565_09515 [Candidatus Parcubacteria bacterium]
MRRLWKGCCARTKGIILFFATAGLIFGFFAKSGWAATYYMPDDFSNLQNAFNAMSSGDTLIVRDGIYSGSGNDITHTQKPPSGSEGSYTIVKAENPGGVMLDGTLCEISDVSYLVFQGLVWRGYNTQSIVDVGSVIQPHHIKFLQCGVFCDSSIDSALRNNGFVIGGSHHILLEDCYAYGNMRYAFYASNEGNFNIFRRCVSRIDAYNTETDIAAFMIYDAQNTELQNCISIDMDSPSDYYLQNGVIKIPKAFYLRNTSAEYDLDNVFIKGCIALNISSGQFVIAEGGNDWNFINTVFWDGYNGIRSRYSGGSWDHCVSGQVSSTTTSSQGVYSEQSSEPVTNSIVYGITTDGIRSNSAYSLCDYNCLYANSNNYYNAAPGSHSYCQENGNAVDPIDGSPGNGKAALKYLVRIEDGSNFDGAASDGGDIGATVLKRIGVRGTLWGETGYNSLTTEDLWPFPNEDIIREKMRSYSYDNGKLSGARGFCADGKQLNGVDDITLTSYIWEYLGNPIPLEIYGSDQPVAPTADTTPPVFSNILANNLTATSATISWTTNELATSQVDYGETVAYGQQVTQMSLLTNHQVLLASLKPSTTYHYKIISIDASGNLAVNADLSFTTNEADVGTSVTQSTLQNFEDGVLWIPGGNQDPTGNGRGWAFFNDVGAAAKIEIDSTIGANDTKNSLKITFDSDNPQIYFRSDDKTTDHMPEAASANRMSFYVRFPEGFPVQPLPYRYKTWEFGTFIHDPANWNDTAAIVHYYHFLTMEEVGNGWVKYIITTRPDHEVDTGTVVPDDMPYYFDSFGRFYLHFGPVAGGPVVPRPFTIWIDEIKFYYDDGSVGGQIHDGGQDDAGFDGEFLPDLIE